MTPDLHFNRWMRRAGILFLIILVYVLTTDMTTPMTSYSMVQRPVVAVAPRVPGEVIAVAVRNNQPVQEVTCCSALIRVIISWRWKRPNCSCAKSTRPTLPCRHSWHRPGRPCVRPK